jgi:hypothetical protein
MSTSTPDDNQPVLVKNLSAETLSYQYDRKIYSFAPGAESIVPLVACRLWFGNPYSRDFGKLKHQRARTNEKNRLSTRLGVYSNPWTVTKPTTVYDHRLRDPVEYEYEQRGDLFFHPNIPHVVVRSLEGEVLPVLVSHPDVTEGLDIAPTSGTETLEDAIARMERQMHAMKLEFAQRVSAPPASHDASLPNDDTPRLGSPEPRDETPRPTRKPRVDGPK